MSKIAYYADAVWFDGVMEEEGGWLLVSGTKVVGYQKERPAGFEPVRFTNSTIFPSLINTHTHAPMVFLRGFADDLPLIEWLNKHIWPIERKFISPELIYDTTLFSLTELIRSGIGCFNDMYFHIEDMARAVDESGVKAVLGCSVMDSPDDKYIEYLKRAEGLIEKYKDNNKIRFSFAPHALYTVKPEKFKEIVGFVNDKDIMLHTHLSETQWEVDEIKKRYGQAPATLMNELGGFDCKSIFAHCVHLTPHEIKIMGDKKVNIAHCLQSNLKLASGFAPVTEMLEAGVNVTIGTDGAASNNDQDMLSEMSSVSLFHKGRTMDPTALNCYQTFEMATKNAAKALHMDGCGELKPGYEADFMVVNYSAPHMKPVYDRMSQLIYSAVKTDITDLYVSGRAVMSNRAITSFSEQDINEKMNMWAKKIAHEKKK